MYKPVLLIMAAGMGSRYGGLKQIDPVDEEGHIIIDFSIYDAIQAGFEKVIFIIKEDMKEVFQETIGKRIQGHIEVEYVYQDMNDIPSGFSIPEGRVKPWGTGHAILSCMDKIQGPFAVINADDYYGREAFSMIYHYLQNSEKHGKYSYAMVGYILENTLTDYGSVARGVCNMSEGGMLKTIIERTHIEKRKNGAVYTEDNGITWVTIPMDSIVSMNMWGFTPSILLELKKDFEIFFRDTLEKNPLKEEFFLPSVVDSLIQESKAKVQVLKTTDKWYGVTYKEDKEVVTYAMSQFMQQGVYPGKLWERRK